jgi:hypothetical protein
MTDSKVRFEDLKGLDDDEDEQKITKKNKYTGLGGLDDDIHGTLFILLLFLNKDFHIGSFILILIIVVFSC